MVSDGTFPVVVISPLQSADGGGYVASFPGYPGCIADGDSPEAALLAARDAFISYLATSAELEQPIPPPICADLNEAPVDAGGEVIPCRGCLHFREPAWCDHPDLCVASPIDFVTGQRPMLLIPVLTARQGECGPDAVLRVVGEQ
jgi:predicted RNase H-like HicB family nuclease